MNTLKFSTILVQRHTHVDLANAKRHYAPLCENMTSSIKPEAHTRNVLRYSRGNSYYTENAAKFGHAVSEIYERPSNTGRQTNCTTAIRYSPARGEVINRSTAANRDVSIE